MNIAIIDYDAGNIGSLRYALSECGIPSYIASKADDLNNASHLILPGVGSFYKAMCALRERELDVAIKQAVLEKKLPILGICLGMQLFASKGDEGGEIRGLDLIPGTIKKLSSANEIIRLPHVGWNEVFYCQNHFLFTDVAATSDFYFVHSYHFICDEDESVLARTNYGQKFTSAIVKNNILGVQFHPEKSGKLGRQLLKNFSDVR